MEDGDGIALLCGLAMAVGLVGTVVPVVPGLLLILAAGVGYGVVEGFGALGVVATAVMVALAAAGTFAGVVVPKRRAGAAGAARSSLLLGAAVGVVGFFVVPIVGFPVGGAAGIYLAERRRTRDAAAAWRATKATLVGFGLAALVQLACGVAMVAAFVVWVLAG